MLAKLHASEAPALAGEAVHASVAPPPSVSAARGGTFPNDTRAMKEDANVKALEGPGELPPAEPEPQLRWSRRSGGARRGGASEDAYACGSPRDDDA